ncbi:hypothetical protein ACIRRH_09440 [Kitasatospora sp. NPDC101235]|uniref:hypothetical protein n=1 Tax=Kitasatospora sp. NPDC101235 TaxID=3364101 RepID=UPI0038182E4A
MDWEERRAYERGRQDERDRIRNAVDGDDGGCCSCLFVLLVIAILAGWINFR